MKYFSAINNAFYDMQINANSIPEDVIEISGGMWIDLMSGISEGKVLSSGKKGNPFLKKVPEPTADEYIAIAERQKNC